MEVQPQLDSRAVKAAGRGSRSRGLIVGLIGGLVATIVIDVITILVMPLIGLPADNGFVIIGDTAARFFSLLGPKVNGGAALGAGLHYVIGLVLGALFGAGVTRIPALRLTSTRKAVGLGVLYTELISLPILITPPLLLGWTASAAAFWFGFSFLMHAVWGSVLGAVVSLGVRSRE